MSQKQKILIYAQDAGGAKAIMPVIVYLKKEWDADFLLVAHLYAIEIFNKEGLDFLELKDLVNNIPLDEKDAIDLLRDINPSLVFCTTSNNRYDPSNGNIIRASRHCRIPNFAVMDHWKGWKKVSNNEDAHFYLPDVLGVIDGHSKQYGESIGIHGNRMAVVGHPYLEKLYYKDSCCDVDIRKLLNIGEDSILCTFFSQPIIIEKNGKAIWYSFLDNGMDSISMLYEICMDVFMKKERNFTFCFKPHPKERVVSFPIVDCSRIRTVDKSYDSLALAICSDVVMGIDSMILYESYFSGCNVVALRFKEFFGLDENFQLSPGFLPEAKSREDLCSILMGMKEFHTYKNLRSRYYPLPDNSIFRCENILKEMSRRGI